MLNKGRLFIPVLLIIILSGCWDNVEIDERAFITGIGFDKYQQKNEKEQSVEGKAVETSREKRYVMTISYPNVSLIAGKEEGDPAFSHSTVCSSPSDGKQQINMRNNKNFYINHTKVIIVGEELAKDKEYMGEVLDVIDRSVYFNRKIHFLVSRGCEAKEIIATDSGKNMDIGLFIEELMEKERISPRRAMTTFDQVMTDLLETNSVMVPAIEKSGEEIKLEGGAILKNNSLVGWLNGMETRAVNMLLDRISVADYTVEMEDGHIVIEQMNSKTKERMYKNKEGNLTVEFKIRMEGIMLQHYFHLPDKPMDAKYIEKLNEDVNKAIKEDLVKTFEKIQKEYKADIFDLSEYLRKHEPDIWNEVKENWDEIYPEIKLDIILDMNIRRIGIEG